MNINKHEIERYIPYACPYCRDLDISFWEGKNSFLVKCNKCNKNMRIEKEARK